MIISLLRRQGDCPRRDGLPLLSSHFWQTQTANGTAHGRPGFPLSSSNEKMGFRLFGTRPIQFLLLLLHRLQKPIDLRLQHRKSASFESFFAIFYFQLSIALPSTALESNEHFVQLDLVPLPVNVHNHLHGKSFPAEKWRFLLKLENTRQTDNKNHQLTPRMRRQRQLAELWTHRRSNLG